MFKWVCLGVAVVALSAFGWMLNDMRLEVKGLVQRADILAEKVDKLSAKADSDVPRILTQAEKVTGQLDSHLPRILAQTEKAVDAVNQQLPPLLATSESTVDTLAELSERFKQYQGLMGVVHGASQNKGLFSYGTSILGFLGEQQATIGVKKPGPEKVLRHPVPAKQWAVAAQPDVHFLSLIAKTKEDVLHGLARSESAAPLYIQLGAEAPRLLADFLAEMHPESKGLK